ncbi:MAG TPA: cation:proton antiporter [Thermoanaerobaculia bacterium]
MPILRDLVLIIASAIAVILISNRFRVPPVVGLLLTGLVIGPYSLGVVNEIKPVRVLAEVGVVALLFTIGLEFSLDRLKHIRRSFLLGGSLQAIGTLALVVPVLLAGGESIRRALFFAFLVILSSTAIVLKLYADRKELETPHGRLVLGILLFQDFLIVPMIILAPVLAGVVEASPLAIAARFGGGLLLIAAVVLVARFVMPKLLYQLVRTRSSEVLILGSLLVGLGMALFTESLHFSMALGAFLAGIIISESEYSHQVIADVIPFKDVFNSLFFISIGMLLDLRFVASHLASVVGLGIAILLVKAAVLFMVVRWMKFPLRTALVVALGLAQVGEFSFVLANSGAGLGLLPPPAFALFIGSSIVTMLITPLLVAWAPHLAESMARGGAVRETRAVGISGHVVIVGFGVNGRNLARVLKEVGIRYTIVDLDGDNVQRAIAANEPITFGDATRREILVESGIETAHTVVFGISDLFAVRKAVRFARQLNSDLRILVRTRQVAEIEDLYQCGADDVVAEEFETSIEIFTRVLEGFHVPTNVISAQIHVLRGDRYQLLRLPAGSGVSEQILDALAAGTTDVFAIRDRSWAARRSLREIDLQEAAGATVIAVVRGDRPHPSPRPDFVLERGDFVVLIGNHASIDQAFQRLEDGPKTTQT